MKHPTWSVIPRVLHSIHSSPKQPRVYSPPKQIAFNAGYACLWPTPTAKPPAAQPWEWVPRPQTTHFWRGWQDSGVVGGGSGCLGDHCWWIRNALFLFAGGMDSKNEQSRRNPAPRDTGALARHAGCAQRLRRRSRSCARRPLSHVHDRELVCHGTAMRTARTMITSNRLVRAIPGLQRRASTHGAALALLPGHCQR